VKKSPPPPPILLAEFKAFHSLEESFAIMESIIKDQSESNLQLYFTLPYTYIEPLKEKLQEQNVVVGVDRLLNTDTEQFTGSISLEMLKAVGAQFVLIGSSHERKFFQEDLYTLKDKLEKTLRSDMKPIVCVSDTQDEFYGDQSKEILMGELSELLGNLSSEELNGLHLLYDPIWINQTLWEADHPDLYKAYHQFNEVLQELFPPEVVSTLRVMYAVPTYSQDLPHIIEKLSASGYSLGILTGSVAEAHPLPFLATQTKDL